VDYGKLDNNSNHYELFTVSVPFKVSQSPHETGYRPRYLYKTGQESSSVLRDDDVLRHIDTVLMPEALGPSFA
jgi:hypothetical protein